MYYLAKEEECTKYIQSVDFQKDLQKLFIHDQQKFKDPINWQTKMIKDSPLILDFPNLWNILKETYLSELPLLAFMAIPDETVIEENFIKITKLF